jgi:DNA-binding NtrC family response regulator
VRKVDVRLLSATNADIGAAVREGRFREDLLYRLNTVEIHLPALRERREDIPALARHFLCIEAAHYQKPIQEFSDEALAALDRHSWPGNVRELEHAIERAVLMARGDRIEAADLALRARDQGEGSGPGGLTLEEAERIVIEKALDRFDGNVSKAADALGLSRSALYRRLQRHDPQKD